MQRSIVILMVFLIFTLIIATIALGFATVSFLRQDIIVDSFLDDVMIKCTNNKLQKAIPNTDFVPPDGDGSQLTSLNASKLTSGTITVARLPNTVMDTNTTQTITSDKSFTQGIILNQNTNPTAPASLNALKLYSDNDQLYTINSLSTITHFGSKSHIFTNNNVSGGQVILTLPDTFYQMPFTSLSGLLTPLNFTFLNGTWTYTGPGTIQALMNVSMFLTISPTQTVCNFQLFKNNVFSMYIMNNRTVTTTTLTAVSIPFSLQFELVTNDTFDIRVSANTNSDQIITMRGFTVSVSAI